MHIKVTQAEIKEAVAKWLTWKTKGAVTVQEVRVGLDYDGAIAAEVAFESISGNRGARQPNYAAAFGGDEE